MGTKILIGLFAIKYYDILMILAYMLSLTSYEYVRSLVSVIIHFVSEYQLCFVVCGLSETNIKNSPAGTKILIFAEKYDMTLI